MASNFPDSLDTTVNLPDNTSDSSPLNNPDHATLHNTISDAVIAVETKMGTGASTPTADTILVGTGTGTSEWQTGAGPTGPTGPSGPSGPTGACGVSGVSGARGVSGVSGVAGACGVSGVAGACGVSGVAGACGVSGVSGVAGACGVSGVAGTAGDTGACGVSGVAGACGVSGVSGVAGACGVSGVAGACGISGVAGACGVSGVAGACGVSGVSGVAGACGVSGIQGDRYSTTSTSSMTIASSGSLSLIVGTGLGYSVGQNIIIVHDVSDYMVAYVDSYDPGTGSMTATATSSAGSGTYSTWDVNLDGVAGVQGPTGACGVSGVSGVAGACGVSGVSGVAGACGVSGVAGACGVSGTTGACGVSGVAGACGVSGVSGATGTAGGDSFAYTFNTGTSAADPGAGKLRFDNATISSVANIYIDKIDYAGTDISTWLNSLAANSRLKVFNNSDATKFATFTLTTVTSHDPFWTLGVTYISGATLPGTTAGDTIITYAPVGACGVSGVSGVTGVPGACGVSGVAGACGVSGVAGACGVSGVAGACGVSGTTGACGVSGVAGACGVSGVAGACGVSGVSGVNNTAGAATATVATAQTTSSTSFTDLATSGPAVTVTIASSGLALVILSSCLSNATGSAYAVMGFAVSGANTIAANFDNSLAYQEDGGAAGLVVGELEASYSILLTGLSTGSTTFTCKYMVINASTASFRYRNISVIPL